MMINLESWQAIGGGIGVVAVAIYNRWEARKTRKAANRAVELSGPTGNGFAASVKESLAEIKKQNSRTEKLLIDHIAAHADADVHNRPRRVLRDVNEL